MIALIGCFAALFLYLEIVYHFSGFGLTGWAPMYVFAQTIALAGFWTLAVGALRGIFKKILFYAVIWLSIVWAGAQLVYLHIFKQPLLWEGIFRGGGDALTNYYREMFQGILEVLPFLLLLLLPGAAIVVVMKVKKWKLPEFGMLQVLRTLLVFCVGIAGQVVTLEVGRALEADYHESYTDFYDPLSVAENMGFLPTLERDTKMILGQAFGGLGKNISEQFAKLDKRSEEFTEAFQISKEDIAVEAEDETVSGNGDNSTASANGSDRENVAAGNADGEGKNAPSQPRKPLIFSHRLSLDYEMLYSLANGNEKKEWLTEYIQSETGTRSNAYTGIFEDYNLIYLTAEGFSPYAVRQELTPTLYKMVNTGFVFENFYSPLWQTSTSDGEYINCTGMIPDGQFSMRKSGSNSMPFTLAGFFNRAGVKSYAYHNNSLSYYDRYVTHPNMGYDFKGCRLGELSGEKWEAQIFPMENPGAWPASDLEMMQGTTPEYISNERFHVYYMTVSGHMNYNFGGNAMSAKNKEAVAELEMSENARAYIACNIELDKALEYLLQQLEAAGQLEKTVICLTADHYPYAMTTEQYEELAGKSLSSGMDMYRNNLILWNSEMEAEPVYVEKACGPMDVVPTLLNLFGFMYDSRMYAGRDIFSDSQEGLVVFNDRSFVTDSVIYNKKSKETIWLTDENGNPKVPQEKQEEYFDRIQQEVKERYQFSAYVLQTDYYSDVLQVTKLPTVAPTQETEQPPIQEPEAGSP